jgi:hypothetical protein
MLLDIPPNFVAFATRRIFDISEDHPIPRGARVSVEDQIRCDDLFVVEYEGRIFLATPDELRA